MELTELLKTGAKNNTIKMKDAKQKHIAYFSMEFALDDIAADYAGGLGVLAGDTVLAAADLELPLVGVSLFYHHEDGRSVALASGKNLRRCPQTASITIEGRLVKIIIWQAELKGRSGHKIPLYFLSTDDPANERWDRDLTKQLYAGDAYTRLGQEAILGIGGFRALKALGHDVARYHLNEGHAALLTLECYRENNGRIEAVRPRCSFTTHTALDSGHDYFDYALARQMLGNDLPGNIRELSLENRLGLTELALNLCGRTNAVSRIHAQVCREKFPGHEFIPITNGVYPGRWAGKSLKKLLDRTMPGWQSEPEFLAKAPALLPAKKLARARQAEKKDFISWLNRHKEYFPLDGLSRADRFDDKILTVGFARRLVPYKRADLILKDAAWLKNIGQGKLQLVFAGNAYDNDPYSQGLLAEIGACARALRPEIKIALIPKYNLDIGRRLVSGCDLWLNTPVPGSEASGTSGMKAALNGVPSLSTMDGWWKEAYSADVRCGWGFGEFVDGDDRDQSDHRQLMSNLENIINCYYERPDEWHEKTAHSIALLAYFNTYRMVREYASAMWQ